MGQLLAHLPAFSGELLLPGTDGYEDARRIHNGMIDKRPAVIARCRCPEDIVRVVALARDRELELSVRGGGHNVSGRAVTEGGVMVDLSSMTKVTVDPTARTARAEGGATWGHVDRATQAHGLAVTGGMISTTGVAGLTLGGGLGWLMGRLGLTADNLLSADVVTADGRRLTASAHEHPELFWGLRGGGGNFGVVTSFELRLHPIGPSVTGVRAVYPFSKAVDVLRFYRDYTTGGPDDLTMNASVLHAPGEPDEKLAGLVGCHVGAPEQAERDLAPLLELGDAVLFEVGPTEYTTINSILDPVYPRGAYNYWKSSFLDGLSDAAIDAIVTQFASCPSPQSVVVLENIHGEVTRVPVESTAFPHRQAGYNLLLTSVWADPALTGVNVGWTRDAFAALRPLMAERCYVNYLAEDEMGGPAVRKAFGPNYERLVAVKRAYDPGNLFRLNQNIDPSWLSDRSSALSYRRASPRR